MNEVIAKNRSGWILHEYINIPEEQISEYQNVTGSYAVVKVGNKYLVGYNDWRKQWEFPAGGIEDGETARQAALRELVEETHQGNLNLEFKGLFKVTDSHGKQKYQAVYLGQKEALEPFAYSENDEMSKIRLWDMTEDIGYVDELDVAIVKMVDTQSISGNCEWCNLTDEDKRYLLYEDEYWMLFLADEQDYIGRSILVLKRHCASLSELNEEEWKVLHNLIQRFETCALQVLGADVCNWSCLMNNFFKEEVPNPHLHIHCRPRLKKPVVVGDNTYADTEFGHHYALKKEAVVTSEDRAVLFSRMKAYWEN